MPGAGRTGRAEEGGGSHWGRVGVGACQSPETSELPTPPGTQEEDIRISLGGPPSPTALRRGPEHP